MSLARPDDTDEKRTETSDSQEATTDNSDAEETPEPDLNESDGPESQQELAGLLESVEANSRAIQEKADSGEVERLRRTVDALVDRVSELEENYRSLHDYILELERNRGEWLEDTEQNAQAVARISTLVLDENPDCPECGEGRLEKADPWSAGNVVCSNNECELY